jgi:hypothetical protein
MYLVRPAGITPCLVYQVEIVGVTMLYTHNKIRAELRLVSCNQALGHLRAYPSLLMLKLL